jgi:hypothetical protein
MGMRKKDQVGPGNLVPLKSRCAQSVDAYGPPCQTDTDGVEEDGIGDDDGAMDIEKDGGVTDPTRRDGIVVP